MLAKHSCRHRKKFHHAIGYGFPVFDSIREYAQAQRLNVLHRFIRRITVGQRAGELRNLRQPSAVNFLFHFDLK